MQTIKAIKIEHYEIPDNVEINVEYLHHRFGYDENGEIYKGSAVFTVITNRKTEPDKEGCTYNRADEYTLNNGILTKIIVRKE